MGITQKLFLFCNCRTSLQYNCLSCLFLLCVFDLLINLWLQEHLLMWYPVWLFKQLTLFYLLMNFCEIYNKSIWTFLSAVFLVFVLAVAISDLARDMILAPQCGAIATKTTAQTAKNFDANSNQQNYQKNFKTAGGSFQYSRGLCWTRPIPESTSSIFAQQGA